MARKRGEGTLTELWDLFLLELASILYVLKQDVTTDYFFFFIILFLLSGREDENKSKLPLHFPVG
jgi:hypothetical protein